MVSPAFMLYFPEGKWPVAKATGAIEIGEINKNHSKAGTSWERQYMELSAPLWQEARPGSGLLRPCED